ncbi:MAG TPA: CBS domain-containing protein [Kofleriaceae bacterium]
MKSIDALIASHLSQVLRPKQRSPWFETDDELTTELRTIRALAKPPQIVGETSAIGEVTNLLLAHRIEAVVVVDATNTPCGVVSASDVLRARPDWTAADAMSAATVQRANASVGATAELMARENALHVVIVEDNQILGLASALDVLAATCLAPR